MPVSLQHGGPGRVQLLQDGLIRRQPGSDQRYGLSDEKQNEDQR